MLATIVIAEKKRRNVNLMAVLFKRYSLDRGKNKPGLTDDLDDVKAL
jgi:hypothetical protein